MSKTKSNLPEDIDVTDPRDTGQTGEPDEPSPADHAIYELFQNINILEQNIPYGYTDEVEVAIIRLQSLYERARKPF